MILAQVWEAIFAQTSTGHSIFSRAFQAQILLGCEASVPQLSKLVHNLHIHAKMGALRTKFKVKIYHGDWDQIFHTFKKWTFWHPLTQKLVKMVMPQYIEGGFMLFSKIHDSHSTTSDQISWLHSQFYFWSDNFIIFDLTILLILIWQFSFLSLNSIYDLSILFLIFEFYIRSLNFIFDLWILY